MYIFIVQPVMFCRCLTVKREECKSITNLLTADKVSRYAGNGSCFRKGEFPFLLGGSEGQCFCRLPLHAVTL